MVTAGDVENGTGAGGGGGGGGGVTDLEGACGYEAQPAMKSVTSTVLRERITIASSSSMRAASRGRAPQYKRLSTAPG